MLYIERMGNSWNAPWDDSYQCEAVFGVGRKYIGWV